MMATNHTYYRQSADMVQVPFSYKKEFCVMSAALFVGWIITSSSPVQAFGGVGVVPNDRCCCRRRHHRHRHRYDSVWKATSSKWDGLRYPAFSSTTTITTTVLYPHRFNGGYDPSSPLTWTPQEAVEFVMFHPCSNTEPKYIGQQLKRAVQHWSGFDVAEFLTRLYLGHPVSSSSSSSTSSSSSDVNNGFIGEGQLQQEHDSKPSVIYEPQNVRTPQWNGLDTQEGIIALTELLSEALALSDALDPREIARCAEEFLLKEYKWPVSLQDYDDVRQRDKNNSQPYQQSQIPIGMAVPPVVEYEGDSFYSRGYAATLAHVMWVVRAVNRNPSTSLGASQEQSSSLLLSLSPDDLVSMVTLPEFDQKDVIPMQLIDFWKTFVSLMNINNDDRAKIVQGMALGGWEASKIPMFVSEIIPSDVEGETGLFIPSTASMDSEWRFLHERFETNHHDLADYPLSQQVDTTNVHTSSEIDQSSQLSDNSMADITTTRRRRSRPQTIDELQNDVESEFDQLVSEYWKRTEIPI